MSFFPSPKSIKSPAQKEKIKAKAYIDEALRILDHHTRSFLNPVYWTEKYQSKAEKREACAQALRALRAEVDKGSINFDEFTKEFNKVIIAYGKKLIKAGECDGLSKEVLFGWTVTASPAAMRMDGLNDLQRKLSAGLEATATEVYSAARRPSKR